MNDCPWVSGRPAGISDAYCLHGSAQYHSGRIPEAQTAYRQAVPLAEQTDDRWARVYALAYQALIAAEEDRLSEAQTQLNQANNPRGASAPGEHSVGMTIALIATAIIRDRESDTAAAFDAADMAVEAARAIAGILEVAKALVVKARIDERRGDHQSATEGRREAAAALEGRVDPDIARRLLTSVEPIRGPAKPIVAEDEQLTDKELEILRLLAPPLSRREIGEQLYVSPNTVKTHQRAVYRKLGVDSRAAAVDRARQLGVI
jgi:LuxR family maltose regulon positive regulatory protein